MDPIGFFRSAEDSPALAPRQGVLTPDREGRVELLPHLDPLCLRDIEGFERLWLIFQFHRNETWKPLVLPPHSRTRRGVFATRSPYRPNSLGLTCVTLIGVNGLTLRVSGGDLLDGTPILDIKPYLPYADAFPEAKAGWVDDRESESPLHEVSFEERAAEQLQFLECATGKNLFALINDQLSRAPTLSKSKRIKSHPDLPEGFVFAYRQWRIVYTVKGRKVSVLRVESQWDGTPVSDESAVHQDFLKRFG